MSSKQGLFIVAISLLFHLIFEPVTSNECQPTDWLNDQQLPIEKANGDNSAKTLNIKAEDLEELMKKFCNSLETNQQIAANEAKLKFESLQLNYVHDQQTACDQCESKVMKSINDKYESVLLLHKENMNKLENILTEHNNKILGNTQKYNFLQTFYNYSNVAVSNIVRENDRQESEIFQETLSNQVVTNETNTLIEQSTQIDRQLSDSFSELSADQQQGHITLKGTSQKVQNFHDAFLASSNNIQSMLRLIVEDVTSQKNHAGLLLAIQDAETKLPVLASQVRQLKQNVDDLTSAIKRIKELQMVELGGRFYLFSGDTKTWYDARTFCRSLGLDLASLETEGENRLVVEHAWKIHPGRAMWVGGTDEGSEGRWRWTSWGRALTYTNWRSEYSNSGTKDNCLVICSSNFSDGAWCDGSCTSSYYFVCE